MIQDQNKPALSARCISMQDIPNDQLGRIVQGIERERQRVLERLQAVEEKFDARTASIEKQRKLAMADDLILLEFYHDLLDELRSEQDQRTAAGGSE